MANETPDLSALTSDFVTYGGVLFMKNVNEFDAAGSGIRIYKNVKSPIALPRISATGGPQPYRAQDDTAGNGVEFTDRVLTVTPSKWDFDVDPEKFRNTYLAEVDKAPVPFYAFILNQVTKEYLAHLNDEVAYEGVLNAGGTNVDDIATGWKKWLDDAITATEIVEIATGAITSVNALAKVEQVGRGVPVWMRKRGFIIFCSYDMFDKYTQNYRATNGFQFEKGIEGDYKLDNVNAVLRPVSWLGTSQRILATVDGNLCMGTDASSVIVHATQRRNIIELRPMMPVGFQIADTASLFVNDQE